MLALNVTEATAEKLRELCRRDGAACDGVFQQLRVQLGEPISPTQPGWSYERVGGAILTYDCVVGIARWAAHSHVTDESEYRLSSLLRGSHVAIPRRPKPVRSPALVEALAKIQLEQEKREYAAMLSDVKPSASHGIFSSRPVDCGKLSVRGYVSEEQEWQEVRQQISAILNVLLSVVAVVTAVWWAAGTASPIWKTLVAIPLGLLVAVAETVLYARHWSNIEKRRAAAALQKRN